MATRLASIDSIAPRAFIDRAGIELSRAERYRVFVSLSLLDLGFARNYMEEGFPEVVQKVVEMVRGRIRACDYVALLVDNSLALLFPETSRQGAEVASRRLGEFIRDQLSDVVGERIKEIIPVEMASYPDTAGAKTLAGYLDELADKSRN